MKLELTIHDIRGTELNEGDCVKIDCGHGNIFYCKIRYIPEEQAIIPFHTFAFETVEKIDTIPENAVKAKNDEDYWYLPDKEEHKQEFDNYVLDWRQCEYLLKERCFRIKEGK